MDKLTVQVFHAECVQGVSSKNNRPYKFNKVEGVITYGGQTAVGRAPWPREGELPIRGGVYALTLGLDSFGGEVKIVAVAAELVSAPAASGAKPALAAAKA